MKDKTPKQLAQELLNEYQQYCLETVQNWDTGKALPTFLKFVALSRLLDCRLDDLLEIDECSR